MSKFPEDEELAKQIDEQLEGMPNNPDAESVREVLVAFRREYSTFANRNAGRLDEINAVYRQFSRRVYAILAILAVVLLGLGLESLRLQTEHGQTISQVQAGRRISLRVSCAVQSAVAQAGEAVIAGPSTAPPPAQEAAFERLGFPPFKKRHAQAQASAKKYVAGIAASIDSQIGSKGDKLINQRTGTIDCQRLIQLARLGK